jgi:integrase/recombinase XerD
VKAPRVELEPLEPVDIEAVTVMIDACSKGTLPGERDRAIMLFLSDTGVRAAELVAINLDELNSITGEILSRKGKGRKPRTAFLGKLSSLRLPPNTK